MAREVRVGGGGGGRERRATAKRVWSDSLRSRAAAGFARASKAADELPYKAAMHGSVFEHFLRHPNPRMLSLHGQMRGGAMVGSESEAATRSSEAAMVAKAGVRTHNVEGRAVPSGYFGFAAS